MARSITPAVVMSQKWNKDNHLDHHYMLSKNLVVDLGIYHGFIPIKDEQVKNPRGLKINYMASMRNQAPRPWGFDSSGYGLCCSNKQLEKRLRLNVTLTKRMTGKRDSSKLFILLYLLDYCKFFFFFYSFFWFLLLVKWLDRKLSDEVEVGEDEYVTKWKF